MKLYHYTAALRDSHLGLIMDDGMILPVESNVSVAAEHAGPDVVWLTDIRDPLVASAGGLGRHKTTGRITVEIEDAIPWRVFAARCGSSAADQELLDRSGGGLGHHWHVVPRPVLEHEWTAIHCRSLPDEKFVNVSNVELKGGAPQPWMCAQRAFRGLSPERNARPVVPELRAVRT